MVARICLISENTALFLKDFMICSENYVLFLEENYKVSQSGCYANRVQMLLDHNTMLLCAPLAIDLYLETFHSHLMIEH